MCNHKFEKCVAEATDGYAYCIYECTECGLEIDKETMQYIDRLKYYIKGFVDVLDNTNYVAYGGKVIISKNLELYNEAKKLL